MPGAPNSPGALTPNTSGAPSLMSVPSTMGPSGVIGSSDEASETQLASEGVSASVARVPFIKLTDAAVRRSGRCILQVDEFQLAEGESVALLGPNGAGKSTFVGLLTREIHPLHREVPPVEFRGQARPLLDEVNHQIGYVSSTMQAQISVHLPVWEVVAGGLFGSLGVPKRFSVTPTQRRHVEGVLAQLGIADLVERDVTTLSSGQARRVLVARAVIHDPSALIFDEPCTGLDPQGMFHVRRAMRKVAQQGRAVVLVTHYLEDIIPEIDRVVLVKDAHIIADGPKAEILTGHNIGALFDIPAEVNEDNGYYSLHTNY